jgi:hypothetical protein
MRKQDALCRKGTAIDGRDDNSNTVSMKLPLESVEPALQVIRCQDNVTASEPKANHPLRGSGADAGTARLAGWWRELDELLIDCCKDGRNGERQAIASIRARHPGIASNVIWRRIVELGLTAAKRAPYQQYKWLTEDLEMLRVGYKQSRTGASWTIETLLARHPDWPRSVIWRKAAALGLSRRKNGRRRHSSDEADRALLICGLLEINALSARVKRPIASIESRLSVLHGEAKLRSGFTTKDMMEMLHLDPSAILRLERNKLLLRDRGRITEGSVRLLCREHPEEIPFETLHEDVKRLLVDDYEYAASNERSTKTKQ